jgi:hypothetical protein
MTISITPDQIQAWEAELQEAQLAKKQAAETIARLTRILARTKALERYINGVADTKAPPKRKATGNATEGVTTELSLSDAAVAALNKIGQPAAASAVLDTLVDVGYRGDIVKANVYTALRRLHAKGVLAKDDDGRYSVAA